MTSSLFDLNGKTALVTGAKPGIGRNMLARGSGKIIFTASLLTCQGGITVPGYAASKGGIGQLTKALSSEWAGKGVNVNAIAPGYVATDNTQSPARRPRALQIHSGAHRRRPPGPSREHRRPGGVSCLRGGTTCMERS